MLGVALTLAAAPIAVSSILPGAALPAAGSFPFVTDDALPGSDTPGPNAGMPWRPFRYPAVSEAQAFLSGWAARAPHLVRADTCQHRYGLTPYGKCAGFAGDKCVQPFAVITHWPSWRGYTAGAGPNASSPRAAAASLERPHVFISGSIHGNEQVGPVSSLAAVELLLSNYELAEAWERQCAGGGNACDATRRRLAEAARASAADTRTGAEARRVGEEAARRLRSGGGRSLSGGASAPLPFNPWLRRLVDTRVLVVLPMGNPDGYEHMRRGEFEPSNPTRELDPNRDFPFAPKSAAKCMRTVTARCINELFREHLFQSTITFHGGAASISYEWGSEKHMSGGSESPDDEAQANSAHAMQRFGGRFSNGKWYGVGRMNSVMYPVPGGLEDWSYAGSWEPEHVPQCVPTTYGGYPREKTVYNDAVLRASTMLVETNDAKRPAEAALGWWGPALLAPSGDDPATASGSGPFSQVPARPSGNDPGDVPRNLRLVLAALDLVRPYTQPLTVTAELAPATSSAAPGASGRSVAIFGGGGASLSAAAGASLPGPAADPASLRAEYNRWIDVDAGETPGSAAVTVEWDVGGAVQAGRTGLLAIRWPAALPPSALFALAGLAPPGRSAAAEALRGQSSTPSDSAGPASAAMAELLRDADRADAAAASAAADVLRSVNGSLAAALGTPAGLAANATALPAGVALSASLTESDVAKPARWGDATFVAADASAEPFRRRFRARIELPLAADEAALPACVADGGSIALCPGDFASLWTFVVVPWVIADPQWARQHNPTPAGVPPQTHLARVRTDPSWNKTSGGFVARGQSYFADSAVFVAVADRRGSAAADTATRLSALAAERGVAGPSASPAPTPAPSGAPPSPSATPVVPFTPTPSPSAAGAPAGDADADGGGGAAPLIPGDAPSCGSSAVPQAWVTLFGVRVTGETAAVVAQVAVGALALVGCVLCCRVWAGRGGEDGAAGGGGRTCMEVAAEPVWALIAGGGRRYEPAPANEEQDEDEDETETEGDEVRKAGARRGAESIEALGARETGAEGRPRRQSDDRSSLGAASSSNDLGGDGSTTDDDGDGSRGIELVDA